MNEQDERRRGNGSAPHVPDGDLLERLNAGWQLAGDLDDIAPLKQRLARPFRRAAARLLRPQETFNSLVVQYFNALTTFMLEQRLAWEDGLDEVMRYREAVAARERRMDATVAALRAEHEELRTQLGVLQHAAQQLRREIARIEGVPAGSRPAPDEAGAASGSGPSTSPDGHALSHKYVGFEDRFRGSPEAIRARLLDYLPIFAGASDVLDVGCGRGEFLTLLAEHGIRARGIDLNAAMVDVCRERGLAADEADALSYLRAQPDGSLGGLFAAQVVEHLEPAYLTHLLDAAFDKLRPGAAIVLETINPACWFAFFEAYVRDITHVRPLHPDTLAFLIAATGFQRVEVQFRAPYPEHEKLQPVAAGAGLGDSAEILNANVEKINRLLFTYLDYAAIARR